MDLRWIKLQETGDNYITRNPIFVPFTVIITIQPSRIRWPGHIARMGVMGNAYKIFFVSSRGKRSLEKPPRKFNIKIDLMEVELRVWIGFI